MVQEAGWLPLLLSAQNNTPPPPFPLQGTKRLLLWLPSDHDNLYIEGSSSPIIDTLNPDLNMYPR